MAVLRSSMSTACTYAVSVIVAVTAGEIRRHSVNHSHCLRHDGRGRLLNEFGTE
jgi:hypothetical protein